MTIITNIDLTTLNLKSLQSLAKEFKVKSWWTLKKADLISELSSIQETYKKAEESFQGAEEETQKKELKEKAQKDTTEENPLVPMPGTQDPNWGEKAWDEKADGRVSKKAKTTKVEKNEDNLVTLKELAAEFHMKGTKARRLLRNETAARPFGGNRWEWDKDLHKAELELARSILKAHTK